MDSYALHLAMAALVGASFVAVSTYYMHRKTLTQLLKFVWAVERDRDNNADKEETDIADSSHQQQHSGKSSRGNHRHHCRKGAVTAGYYRPASASMLDVSAIAVAVEGVEKQPNGLLDDWSLLIPAGLPRLHTLPKGMHLSDFSPE